ncbi:MAG: PIG-L family deacetylase [Promethearchaeati archaeon SRVP18_Atabeyarchaeia-1]
MQRSKPFPNSRDDLASSPGQRSGQRFLVFGAHPDDEVVGVGGTIAKLAKTGNEVFVVIFTKGEEGYADRELKDTISVLREKEIERVRGILGVKKYELMGRPDMGLKNDKETFKETIRMIRKFRPDAVFTHHRIDRHRDHRAASKLVSEAFWQAGEAVAVDLGSPWRSRALYYFEEVHPFRFPSHIVDISETFDAKISAMKTYTSQLPVVPFILSGIEGQAIARGSAIGAKYGEAFLRSNATPRRELEF